MLNHATPMWVQHCGRLLLVVVSAVNCGFAGQAAPSLVQAVSVANPKLNPQTPSGGDSTVGDLSANGRLAAFVSSAANLVTNAHRALVLEVYVRDRQTGAITLVSVSADGHSCGDDHSTGPAFSAEGRLVVFESAARNLVTNSTSGSGDIYVRDLVTATTRLVSANPLGRGGNGASSAASITPDGRFVLFESAASDLVTNDTNGAPDVFVRDLKTETTTLVSANWQGTASAANPTTEDAYTAPVITPDGRYVAFQSLATNLTQPAAYVGSNRPSFQIYVRDLLTGTNILVSASAKGEPGSNDSEGQQLSTDGRYVLFASLATNLPAPLTPPDAWGLYRRDLLTGTTLPISDIPNASQPSLSTNGQVVAYAGNGQVYVWTEATGTAQLVSTNSAGQPGAGRAYAPRLSADGKKVVYLSDGPDVVAGATNGQFQVFVYDLTTGTNVLVSSAPGATAGSSSDCLFPAITPDARVIAFQAFDGNLVSSDNNDAVDVFVRDLANPAVELVSLASPTLPPMTAATTSRLAEYPVSADGRYVLFTTAAANLAPNDTNGADDVFVRDTVLGTTTLVSVNQAGTAPGNGESYMPVMTPDGRFVAFISRASDLVLGDTNNLSDVFVRDLVTGTTVLASVLPVGAVRGEIYLAPPVFSADGRYVAFTSTTSTNWLYDLFLRDLKLGTTTSIKKPVNWPGGIQLAPTGLTSDQSLWYVTNNLFGSSRLFRYDIISGRNDVIGPSSTPPVFDVSPIYVGGWASPAFTPEGRFVAGQILSHSPVGGYTNQVWRYDRLAKNMQIISSNWVTKTYFTADWRVSISANGRFIAFVTPATNLSILDQNRVPDVYVADAEQPGKFILVSINQTGTAAGNGASDGPCLSADGRFVSFRSAATDLVAGMTNSTPNLYVRDLQAGVTRLVTANPGGTSGDNRSFKARLSTDGSTVAFESGASDLVASDYNNLPDVFIYHLSAPHEPLIRVRLLPLRFGQPPSIVWTAETAKNYRVQFKNQLSDTAWQNLLGAPVPYGANELVLPDASPERGSQRYYRVVGLP